MIRCATDENRSKWFEKWLEPKTKTRIPSHVVQLVKQRLVDDRRVTSSVSDAVKSVGRSKYFAHSRDILDILTGRQSRPMITEDEFKLLIQDPQTAMHKMNWLINYMNQDLAINKTETVRFSSITELNAVWDKIQAWEKRMRQESDAKFDAMLKEIRDANVKLTTK